MASKKEKILESAQRFVLKGQIDKAIKDYQQVVAMEPNDIRYRQRLAELLVRDNRKDEAIQQYEDIGKHYADNGYFLKAIAIYKQIQRLNPGNLATALTIAHLNHQQGLIGNAMAEYSQVAAQYEKEGALKEVLKVVEKMLGVDAEHAATKLKYAELLYATGAQEQSREAFAALAAGLRSRGLADQAASVAARAHELFPEQEEAQPAPLSENEGLSLTGFESGEEVPGVQAPAAHWEAPVEEPVLPDWDAPAAELPDPFAAPAATPHPEPAPVEASPASYEAPAPWDTEEEDAETAGSIAWEEEIELDLDDDLFEAAPAPEAAAVVEAPQPSPEPAAPPAAEVELPLDFSLELNFDEVEEKLEEAEPEEATASVVELDLEQGGELELTLPDQEAPIGEFSWEEEAELPQEPAEPEQAAEPTEIEEVELELEPVAEIDLEAETSPGAEALTAPEQVQPRGWEEIFPQAEAGAADLDLEELESHYDLGIGYKEMGMYAGAIKEFEIAAANPQRRFDCLTLQAICYRDKGEPAKAEELLRRGLDLDVISKDERTCLNYELAVLAEGSGAVEKAIELYREVMRANPAYQDASSRLSALSGEEVPDIIDLELEEGA
ncbi:tetratricopeptide repeat protein [Geomonas nitrogeniifigens]|uniref:tetratricopeptide repeat protein n=1 Tax=Geomonas diazotrophica TaxID=2843197 RepID=UPI001C2BA59E|nr:tetratricopeptide repeat protein [Geomonas nitrogeniifigens]QXE85308.1 tetratricopeptide repeat protein [Geomonas nitrogeniifigens]